MTTKEFLAKHYSSLSMALFGLALLAVLAIYGSNFNSLTGPPPEPAAPAPSETVAPKPESEEVSPQQAQAEGGENENAEPDRDPLEQAMADEAAKAEERRNALREQIAKDREQAGMPPLPAKENSETPVGN